MALSSYKQDSFLSETRVLLIDPDGTNHSILSGAIEELKPAHFMVAKSIGEGRLALGSRVDSYDLILLAIKNPPLSGFHFLQELRGGGIPRVPRDTRIVLISQPPNRTMIELAGALDADGFFALPMSLATCKSAITKALKRTREIKAPGVYTEVKLPKPVRKQPKKESKPSAWGIWSKKEKEKADLLQDLENVLKDTKDEEKVEPKYIKSVRTFWLKDLHSGMILAEDINGEENELLLASGTPLNDPLINQIKRISEFGLCRSFLKAGAAPEG